MLTRSSLLSLLLIVAIGLVATKTYWLWNGWPLGSAKSEKGQVADRR